MHACPRARMHSCNFLLYVYPVICTLKIQKNISEEKNKQKTKKTFSHVGAVNVKIEQNAFSKYVLDLLVEQFASYCEARFSFFKITTPPALNGDSDWGLRLGTPTEDSYKD